MVELLVADPGLGERMDPADLPAARRRGRAEGLTLDRGMWRPLAEPQRDHALGLLIVRGLIVRRISLAGRSTAELLGSGDMIRPDEPDSDDYATVPQEATWRVLEPVTVALLDHDLVARLSRFEGVLPTLSGRLVQRSRALAVRLAIAQQPNLAARLDLLFWHLADRWGKREGGQVRLTVRLSQQLLADLVGAHRTSVNAALRDLRRRQRIAARRDGTWTLCGDPPSELLARAPR
jgi:CRP/FNR family transcriptional regulator, cyclic AMP receptor protein